jgi:cob(I)alamin adenosyltransferase
LFAHFLLFAHVKDCYCHAISMGIIYNGYYFNGGTMRYYSTKGDSGSTNFGRAGSVSKADREIEFVGALDEAQVALGFAATEAEIQMLQRDITVKNNFVPPAGASLQADKLSGKSKDTASQLADIHQVLCLMQWAIFSAGTVIMELADKAVADDWLWSKQLAEIESLCELFAPTEPLKAFVLPGGSELAARIELARVAIRRLERVYCQYVASGECDVATVGSENLREQVRKDALPFFNRLSSLAFVLARRSNELLEVPERTL